MSEETAAQVLAQFPDILNVDTEYLFDQEILSKYIDPISEALSTASGIPEEELAALILAKEKSSVKKGTIDTIPTYGDKMVDVFNAISPIISLK